MTPDTETFLELVRHAEEPSREDEQRVLRALQASVASGSTPTLADGAGPSEGWLGHVGTGVASTIAKLSVVAVSSALALSVDGGAGAAVPAPPTSSPAATAQIATRPTASVAPPAPAAASVPAETSSSPRLTPDRAPAPAPKSSARRVPSLREELALLAAAQRALKDGDGESALRELDRSTTREGPLLAERRAARILALCAVGRDEEARAASRRFDQDHADSAHREAIRRACTNLQRKVDP